MSKKNKETQATFDQMVDAAAIGWRDFAAKINQTVLDKYPDARVFTYQGLFNMLNGKVGTQRYVDSGQWFFSAEDIKRASTFVENNLRARNRLG